MRSWLSSTVSTACDLAQELRLPRSPPHPTESATIGNLIDITTPNALFVVVVHANGSSDIAAMAFDTVWLKLSTQPRLLPVPESYLDYTASKTCLKSQDVLFLAHPTPSEMTVGSLPGRSVGICGPRRAEHRPVPYLICGHHFLSWLISGVS